MPRRTRSTADAVVETIDEGIASLYQLERTARAKDFLLPAGKKNPLAGAGSLLIRDVGEELELALVFDRSVQAGLTTFPRHGDPLREKTFPALAVAIEEVSHFRYLVFRAEGKPHSVSALELELQAEIDRFLVFLLWVSRGQRPEPAHFDSLFARLFDTKELHEGMSEEHARRYREAQQLAMGYLQSHREQCLTEGLQGDFLAVLRRFYRLSLHDKAAEAFRQAA